MSKLWTLIQTHLDETGVREAEFARRMGTTPQTLNSWKKRGLKALPERRFLDAVADLTRTPYPAVLAAALADIGYDAGTEMPHPASRPAEQDLVELSFKADDAEAYARAADGLNEDDPISEVIEALDDLIDAVYDLTRIAQRIAAAGVGGADQLALLREQAREARRRRRRGAAKPNDLVTSEGSVGMPPSDEDMALFDRRDAAAHNDHD